MKKTLFIALLLLAGMHASAQIPEAAKCMLSPNTAALGEYGEVPVSIFTGIPQIEIPLYTIECGPHTLPISLSYHASGVRPDQHPGWTGLGWTLNAGGCISRVVKDSIDEYSNPVELPSSDSGERFQRDRLGRFWSGINPHTSDSELSSAMKNAVEGGRFSYAVDYEADEFRFDFLGYHGKFYSDNGEWRVQCDRAVLISPLETMEFVDPYCDLRITRPDAEESALKTNIERFGRSRAIRGFTLTAEDGTRYEFGGDLAAIEYSVPFWSQESSGLVATSWQLTRIVYTDGRTVTFKYGRTGFNMQFATSKFVTLNKIISIDYSHGGNESVITGDPIYDDRNCCTGQLIRPSYLSSIQTEGTEVRLAREESRELDYDLYDVFCDHFRAVYSDLSDLDNIGKPHDILPLLVSNCDPDFDYQSVPNYSLLQERADCGVTVDFKKELHLDSLLFVKMSGMSVVSRLSGDTVRTFSFSYNNDAGPTSQRLLLTSVAEGGVDCRGRQWGFGYIAPDSLPPYLANENDHWGFFNGKKAVFSHTQTYHRMREPERGCMQYGTLNRIDYPTGGHTRIYYEPHTYSQKVAVTRDSLINTGDTMAGGLRVRRTETWAEEGGDTIIHDYIYAKGYVPGKPAANLRSSGILGGDVGYFYANYRPGLQYHVSKRSIIPGSGMAFSFFSSQSMLPGTENACGCHVGYSEVAEVTNDGACTVYRYTNFDDGNYDELCDVSLQSDAHRYTEPYNDRSFSRGLLKMKACYENKDGVMRLRSVNKVKYGLDDSTSKNFVRAFRITVHFPMGRTGVNDIAYAECTAYRHYICTPRKTMETLTVYEDGSTAVTDTVHYAYHDFTKLPRYVAKLYGNGDKVYTHYSYITKELYPQMFNSHIFTPLVETTVICTENGVTDTTSVVSNVYSESDRISLPLTVTERKGGLRSDGSVTRYSYDKYLNPVEETVNDALHTVYIWGYCGQYIVAVIRGALLQDVLSALNITDISAFESAHEPDFDALDRLRLDSRLENASVSTYRYSPLVGVREVTFPDGKKAYYDYDGLERLRTQRNHTGKVVEHYDYNYANGNK